MPHAKRPRNPASRDGGATGARHARVSVEPPGYTAGSVIGPVAVADTL
jgi:hypothetical protein